MIAFSNTIISFNRTLGRILMAASLLMALVQGITVALRALFELAPVFMPELVWSLNAAMLLMGAGFAHGERAHVRMDILYRRLKRRGRVRVDRITNLIIISFCLLTAILATPFILRSWQSLEGSIDIAGLPGLFVLKTMLWLFAGLLALQCVAVLIPDRGQE